MPRTVRFRLNVILCVTLFMVEWPGIVSSVASPRYWVHMNGILSGRSLSSSSRLNVVRLPFGCLQTLAYATILLASERKGGHT